MISREPADPVDHVGQVGVQHLGVQVQELSQDRLVGPSVVMVMLMGVMAIHASTLRAPCAIDIGSCL